MLDTVTEPCEYVHDPLICGNGHCKHPRSLVVEESKGRPAVTGYPNTPRHNRARTSLEVSLQQDSLPCACAMCRRAEQNKEKTLNESQLHSKHSDSLHAQVPYESRNGSSRAGSPSSGTKVLVKKAERPKRCVSRKYHATHDSYQIPRHRYDRIAPFLKQGISSLADVVGQVAFHVQQWYRSRNHKRRRKAKGYAILDDSGIKSWTSRLPLFGHVFLPAYIRLLSDISLVGERSLISEVTDVKFVFNGAITTIGV